MLQSNELSSGKLGSGDSVVVAEALYLAMYELGIVWQ
jgi:hypothetical protein